MYLKRLILILFATTLPFVCTLAQIKEPVKLTASIKDSSADNAELLFTAVTQDGWHIYSTNLPSGGPSSTTIQLDTLIGAELVGQLTPGKGETEEFDTVFEMQLRYFDKKGTFTQKVRITDPLNYKITGSLNYSACNDESCLPPTDYMFAFYGPNIKVATPDTQLEDNNSFGQLWEPVTDQLREYGTITHTKDHSWIYIIIMGFIGGLLALFTPCVWPIIPMTVSFFLKRNSNKRKGIKDAMIYGASIVVIYVTLGMLVTLLFGASALNALSTNAIFNIFFFLLLMVFGLSFLGFFEITLPSGWSTKIDNKAEKSSGLMSIFLMAFTLALVSFSCTGPIIGFLLVEVSTMGSYLGPALGMLGFALALALPFTLFALFPTWLNSAPKSGGWMTDLKVFLGVIEIAFAFKFLSVADLAYGWGILDREIFLIIWILLALFLGLYMLGIVKRNKKPGIIKILTGIASLAVAAYMVPGLWGAPCKAVSAFAPPMYTQTWNIYDNEVHAKYNHYEKGMEFAQLRGKPVLLDFTGYGCVNCRKMEAAVWTDPQVSKIINNHYVLVTLFVDDKSPLENPIKVVENGTERTLKTVGDKWSYLQRVKFGANAQPFYVLLDNNGNPLGEPYSFDQNIDNYIQFLTKGLEKYKNRQ
ncbi:MAG: cytochrome c biogenesis protein CcdA [Bacteroidales bacterium]|nr:cytochrome c biogenesis protein CcdA [Bacteroidales bacterium]